MLVKPEILEHFPKLTDTTSSRYALGGVRLERDDKGKAHAVATDGRALIHAEWCDRRERSEYPGATGVKPGFEAIVASVHAKKASKLSPRTGIARHRPILRKVHVDEVGANGSVNFSGNDLEAKQSIDARQVEGRFPGWRDVIPSSRRALGDIDGRACDELLGEYLEKLGRREPLDEEVARAAIRRHPSHKRRALELLDAMKGGNHCHVEVELDPDYVAKVCDVLKRVACSDQSRGVTLRIPVDGLSPVVIRKESEGVLCEGVVMPIARDK